MPEQLIDTRFPGQEFSVGTVVTFLDRHRRTVFGTVTELRRHEAIVAGGETGRWRVRYAGLRLINAGPTGEATMRRSSSRSASCCERPGATSGTRSCTKIARAIVGLGHRHDAVWQPAARRIGCTAPTCQDCFAYALR